MIVGGCAWLWVVVSGIISWVIVGGCGWLWVVVGDCGIVGDCGCCASFPGW